MAVLAICWLIIESYLIPKGFMKWFYLSFYINPFFLFFCQIVLWINTLQRWVFRIIFLLNRYIFSYVRGVLTCFFIKRRPSSGFSDNNTKTEDEDVWYEVTDSSNSSNTTTSEILFLRHENSGEIPKVAFCDIHVEPVDQETVSVFSSSNLDDEITTFSGASSPLSSYSFGSRKEMGEILTTPSSPFTLPEYQETANTSDIVKKGLTDFPTPVIIVKPDEEEKYSFYKAYTERMRWFDLLNEERTCGLNAFLTKKQYLGGEKRIVKSLESDFEMVYVAQSCLSWEALHDQYIKLQGIVASRVDNTCTSPYGVLCRSTSVKEFQRFQILIERFMEDERSEKGKRYWNFIQKRSSSKSLLQVPEISENVDDDTVGRNEELMIRATDLLKTIEKCMKTFKSFMEVDAKKPWWRASRRLSWSRSPLEDPRDFNFLYDLARTLRQKELWIKDIRGKQRCWLRRVKIMQDVEKKEMMFSMIELKLVSRVLMMSVISTSQLQWCKQKLDNIEISNGRITRTCTNSLLFPSS